MLYLLKIILFFFVVFIVIAGGRFVFLNIGEWLSRSDELRKADVIICLSHDDDRVRKAIDLLKQGYSDTIVATTDLVFKSLIKREVQPENILRLDHIPRNTFQEALFVAQLLRKNSFNTMIVVSDPFHLYRVRWSFNYVLPGNNDRIMCISSGPQWAEGFWWNEKISRRYVFYEIPNVIYYWIVYGMLGFEDDPEWGKNAFRWYNKIIRNFS